MSKKVIERLKASFGDRILETSDFRGDEEAVVAPKDWREVSTFLRDDGQILMDHFVDLTAVDWPLRPDVDATQGRFDVLVFVRSMKLNHRVRLKVRLAEDQPLDSLIAVWAGANWAEREVFDMFGIKFNGHGDLRRILMYEEFEGFPLRKDYPIAQVQPLVDYREVDGIDKLPPFGDDEGQPFARTDWAARMAGRDHQVSTGIGVSVGDRKNLSQGVEYVSQKPGGNAGASDE